MEKTKKSAPLASVTRWVTSAAQVQYPLLRTSPVSHWASRFTAHKWFVLSEAM